MAIINRSPYREILDALQADSAGNHFEMADAIESGIGGKLNRTIDKFTNIVTNDYDVDAPGPYNLFGTQGTVLPNILYYVGPSGSDTFSIRYTTPDDTPDAWNDNDITLKYVDANGHFCPFSVVDSSLARSGALVANTNLKDAYDHVYDMYIPVFEGSADLQPVAYDRSNGGYYYWNNTNHTWTAITN